MNIDTVIEGVDKLSPSLKLLPKLQDLLNDDDSTIGDIAKLIKLDPALTAQVLRLCNSPYFGANESTHCIDEALERIGFDEAYKIVAISSAGKLYQTDLPFYKIVKNEIIETSGRCAAIMQDLSRFVDGTENDAYVIGLLYKLGKIIVHSYILEHETNNLNPDDYPEGLTPEDELKILGFDRGMIAARLLEKWSFPPSIYEPIEYMAHPQNCQFEKIASLLVLANYAAMTLARNPHASQQALVYDSSLLKVTGIDKEDFFEAAKNSGEALDLIKSATSD